MLRLSAAVKASVISDCQKRWPQEACGVIMHHESRPMRVKPIDNVASDPFQWYQFDPGQQRAAWNWMEDEGYTPLAIYHSHPNGPAGASGTDMRSAWFDGVYYVIVDLTDRENPGWHTYLSDGMTLNDSDTVVP